VSVVAEPEVLLTTRLLGLAVRARIGGRVGAGPLPSTNGWSETPPLPQPASNADSSAATAIFPILETNANCIADNLNP
jgi:hypothetical protein